MLCKYFSRSNLLKNITAEGNPPPFFAIFDNFILQNVSRNVASEEVIVDAFAVFAEGENLVLELGNSVELTLCVGYKTLFTAAYSVKESAKAVFLYLEAAGLVFKHPLLFKGLCKGFETSLNSRIFLVCKAEKLCLIACLIRSSGLYAKLVFIRKGVTKLCSSVKEIAPGSALSCSKAKLLCVFQVLFSLSKLYGRVKEADEGVGIEHIFTGVYGRDAVLGKGDLVRLIEKQEFVKGKTEESLKSLLYKLHILISLYKLGNKEEGGKNAVL